MAAVSRRNEQRTNSFDDPMERLPKQVKQRMDDQARRSRLYGQNRESLSATQSEFMSALTQLVHDHPTALLLVPPRPASFAQALSDEDQAAASQCEASMDSGPLEEGVSGSIRG